MGFRLGRSFAVAGVAALLCGPAPLMAQWIKFPTAGVPRLPDGKPNLAAPAPRTGDGKPDFSGMWLTDDGMPCPPPSSGNAFIECGIELGISRYGLNIAQGVKGGMPYKPETQAIVGRRSADNSKDDPHARCMPDTFLRTYGLPHYGKYIQMPGLLVMLNENNATYRQIFTDNRPFPEDPTPGWNGYSSAKWEGDTLVVNSVGFRDDLWIDMAGNVITDKARVQERIRRPDYGHLVVDVMVDDSKAYTRPWEITLKQKIVVDTELIDEFCVENEKSWQRMQKQ
jgi:hypothetical protein